MSSKTLSELESSGGNEKLTIIDVMRRLHCTRYTVMKYYTMQHLPLEKQNNKYYIERHKLNEWIRQRNYQREQQRKRETKAILIGIFIVIVLIVALIEIAIISAER